MRLGALEAGGTKMVLAIGNERGEIFDEISIPTVSPEITMPVMIKFFKSNNIEALGIGCFGPICLDKSSENYGHILNTPKLKWQNYDILGSFKNELSIPISFDTDVNASVLGEYTYGSSRGLKNLIYLTVGTGIGGGIISEGNLIHGMQHPELGHIPIKKRLDDNFKGICPYHASCLEGLASGPAIAKRYGEAAFKLNERDDVWDLEAHYIAEALSSFILCLSPDRIILGGGVMKQLKLFPLIREKVKKYMNGYISIEKFNDIDNYIIPASLKGEQGIMGALRLAELAINP